MNEYTGSWVQRPGGVRVPVLDAPVEVTNLCRVCGSPCPVEVCRPCRDSARERVHGSHAGFNQHTRRFENPCQECAEAERVYNTGARWSQRHRLSEVDRAWCERNAVKFSWLVAERTNRRLD